MKKYRDYIILALVIVLTAIILTDTFVYAFTPRLPKWEKEKIEAIYYESWIPFPDRPELCPLIWYDENGGVEEEFVWRYIGTYGYCYAFLQIGDNENAIYEPVDIPYPIRGLTREVYYPIEAEVILYHTNREFTYAEVCSSDFDGETIKLWILNDMDNREEWLTDAQLERLTRDIEKISGVE